MIVSVGFDILLSEHRSLLTKQRVALLTNSSGLSHQRRNLLRSNYLVLREQGVNLVALFSPEHGLASAVADAEPIASGREARTGLPVYSLYGDQLKPTEEMLRGIDLLLYDVQDVGARFYTYTATLAYTLEACAKYSVPLAVLDRPNPVGGRLVEGPILDPALQSFIGHGPLPVRYGLTLGELARFYNGVLALGANLRVVPLRGWRRDQWFDQTGLQWVQTSPSMPHLSTATVYPGLCLIEGTNLSEGRGTPTPFECTGAPWIDGLALSEELNALGLEGIRFRPVTFTPSFWRFAHEECHGIYLHVTNRTALRSVLVGLHVIATVRRMYPSQFTWNARHFDWLIGDGTVRARIEAGESPEQMVSSWIRAQHEYQGLARSYQLYD